MITEEHIQKSIDNALESKSNITEYELNIRGFSTATQRHLINNLCNIHGTYLEVGLFCGATFCSSFNKGLISVGVEDFSQDFSVPTVEKELRDNYANCYNNSKDAFLFNVNFFETNKIEYLGDKLISKYDIYYYDGNHGEEFQAKALPHFIDNMNDTFIFIIDDTNWKSVIDGTKKGFDSLRDKIEIKREWKLRGMYSSDDSIWHNGVDIYLINKK